MWLMLTPSTRCSSLIHLDWKRATSVKVEGWILNFEFLLTHAKYECAKREGRQAQRKTYVYGDVPGHVDVRFVFIHPHLSGPQGITLGIVIDVIVVGLLSAFDVGDSSTGENLHTPTTLPHLHRRSKASPHFNDVSAHNNHCTQIMTFSDF